MAKYLSAAETPSQLALNNEKTDQNTKSVHVLGYPMIYSSFLGNELIGLALVNSDFYSRQLYFMSSFSA